MFLRNVFINDVKSGGLLIYSILILVMFTAGCNTGIKGNPAPKDFLKNAKADIFMLEDIVYSNAQNIEWVQQLDYKVGEQVGEITKQTDKAIVFTNGVSNKLPVGTKIYRTNNAVYIAVIEGEEIPYLAMLEG
jgi:hypothetical protein